LLHNRIVTPCIYEVLDARGWSVSKLAAEAGTKRSVLAAQLSGTRRIQPRHLIKYLKVVNHQERPILLSAWLRDYLDPDLVKDLLNATADGLAAEVENWAPPLDAEDERMLHWWAREIARDRELEELFKLLSARAGYHPKRTAADPVKRRRRGGGGAMMALLIFISMFASAPFAHTRQLRAAAITLRGRECFLFSPVQAA
jgi:hypothetical protein